MATIVQYGTVKLYNILTRQWDQTVEMDDSKTDALFVRYHLRFDAIVHGQGGSTGAIENTPTYVYNNSGDSATSVYKDIVSQLSCPRLPLTVKIRTEETGQAPVTETLLECYPTLPSTIASVHRDVDNGPKPKILSISMIAGGGSFRVSWSVECAKVVCLSSHSANVVPWILNNRWSVEETLDSDFRTTRVINGDMRLSVPVAMSREDYKVVVVPGLENGFRRESINFATDKTGLRCTYSIQDRQVNTASPWPATHIDATHTESTNDGVNMVSEMSVRLTGRPDADKRLLIWRAVQVLDSRLKFLKDGQVAGVGKDNGFLVDSAAITDHIGEECVIEARLRLRRCYNDPGAFLANLQKDTLGQPLKLDDLPNQPEPYSPDKSPIPAIYGYNPPDGGERRPSVILLMACYLQNPCNTVHGINKGDGDVTSGGKEKGEGDKAYPKITEDVTSGGKVPDAKTSGVSESAASAMYTYATMESKYTVNKCVLQLPIASQSNGTTTSGNGADTSANNADAGNNESTSVFVTLARGQCRRVITCDFERAGTWPEVMEPVETYQDGAISGRLLDYELIPLPPTLAADQAQRLWRVHGRYVYGLNRPPRVNERISAGVLPFTKYSLGETQFDGGKSYTRRLGPAGDATTGGTG